MQRKSSFYDLLPLANYRPRDYEAMTQDASDLIRNRVYVSSDVDELRSHQAQLLVVCLTMLVFDLLYSQIPQSEQSERILQEGAILPFELSAPELHRLYTRELPKIDGLQDEVKLNKECGWSSPAKGCTRA